MMDTTERGDVLQKFRAKRVKNNRMLVLIVMMIWNTCFGDSNKRLWLQFCFDREIQQIQLKTRYQCCKCNRVRRVNEGFWKLKSLILNQSS